MQLPKKEIDLFFKLLHHLLIFTNNEKKIFKKIKSIEEFYNIKLENQSEIRDTLFQNIDLIDKFIDKNPYNFSEIELGHILKWKNFKMGKFYIMTFLKDCTVFYESSENSKKEAKPYGVMSLYSRFDEMIDKNQLPYMIHANLIPFKDWIVTDGLWGTYNIYFGSNMARSLKQEYNEAKAKYGIIKNFDQKKKNDLEQKIDLLKMYLKTDRNIEYYKEEVEKLINQNKKLFKVYIQEIGKKQARKLKKYLESCYFRDCFFAVFGESIIASGKTKKELEKNLKNILHKDNADWINIFRLKK